MEQTQQVHGTNGTIKASMESNFTGWLSTRTREQLATIAASVKGEIAKRVEESLGLLSLFGDQKGTAEKVAVAKPMVAKMPKKEKSERLSRRSTEEISEQVANVVKFISEKYPEGARAEQIREGLSLDKREVPSIMKAALSANLLRSTGQKRATAYHVNPVSE